MNEKNIQEDRSAIFNTLIRMGVVIGPNRITNKEIMSLYVVLTQTLPKNPRVLGMLEEHMLSDETDNMGLLIIATSNVVADIDVLNISLNVNDDFRSYLTNVIVNPEPVDNDYYCKCGTWVVIKDYRDSMKDLSKAFNIKIETPSHKCIECGHVVKIKI